MLPPHGLPAATRESAFVHAIASAGVAFAVTRSCAEGTSTICGCDSHHKGPPGEGWKWGGCSEDADFGVLVSREFADARENRPDARSAMNKHNNEAGRTVSQAALPQPCREPPSPPPLPPPFPSGAGLAPTPPLPAALWVADSFSPWPGLAPSPPHSHFVCPPSFLLGQFLDSTPPGMSRLGSMATPWDQVPPTHPVHLGTRCRAVKSWEPGSEFSLHSLTVLV